MSIQKLIIEDVRCFGDRQEFNIRPLTFLVGENSSGKSTMLGCFHALSTFMTEFRESGIDFNAEPYQMGSFVDIVKRSRPENDTFRLGFVFQNADKYMEYFLDCRAKKEGSVPVVSRQELIFKNESNQIIGKAICETGEQPHHPVFHSMDSSPPKEIDGVITFTFTVDRQKHMLHDFWGLLMHYGDENLRGNVSSRSQSLTPDFLQEVKSLTKELSQLRIESFAPIRSRPQRTYDPLKEESSPEGSDIPVMLRNMSMHDRDAWQKLKEQLVQFGKASGLFADIDARKFGKTAGDPFQLHLKIKGPKVNLIDTGYGVNQILPILVRILNSSQSTTFLMQQPEVHLHPKGQAELSSLLIDLIKGQKHRFIIETHSDYMVDRARIGIMNKKIAPENVSLIYLEPTGNGVKVHNIQFDNQANLVGAPNGYRDFFINESDKLLGFNKD